MELKSGYKQTEAGVLPEDWDATALGVLAAISAGGTPDRTNGRYWAGDIPWVTTTEVDFNVVRETAQFITKEGLDNSAAKMLPAGTLLMALYGQGKTRGKVALLGIDAATNQACAAIVLLGNVDSSYVFHFLISRYKAIRDLSNIGNQENLNNSIVRSISILLPPPEEQKAIATALNDATALLEGLDRLIAKKRDLKQAAMQQLLTGKTRLPGFEGKWETKELGAVIDHCSSGATPYRGRPEFYRGTIKWITSGELNYNLITETIEHISEEAVRKTNLTVHPVGTFLMAITGLEAAGTRGACGFVGSPAATNQSCMAIYPNNRLVTGFLFHYYILRGNELAFKYCQGTKQQSYTARLVRKLPIDLPPTLDEQKAIAAAFFDMDAEIGALEQRRAKTRHLKVAIMQELLTGKTRLASREVVHA